MAANRRLAPPVAEADDPEYAANLRRATLASTAGSALEYYDFALYGLATALIFSKLFFTNLSPSTALIASFATFGVGFIARPLGGLFFGTVGDKLGRKWVLVVTILLMGGASTLVGLLPTYNAIGVWAPILLVFLRLCQGFGAGAEQAGATVLMSEYAPVKSRGFFAALPFIGIQAGTLLAAGVFAFMGGLPDDVLLGWAWRIPFLASFLLVLIALFIRLRLRESPTFIALEKSDQISEHPFTEIRKNSLGSILRGMGLRMAENGGSYMFNSLAVAYATGTIMVSKSIGPLAVAVASLIGMVSVPLAGWISDRVGRVPVYRFGAIVLLLVLAFPGWYLISLGNPAPVILVIAYRDRIRREHHARCAVCPAPGDVRQQAPLPRCGHLPRVQRRNRRRPRRSARRRADQRVQRILGAARHLRLRAGSHHLRHHIHHPGDQGSGSDEDHGRAGRRASRSTGMNLFDLTDKTALVTGSSRGIGYALAQGLLQAGARVVVHGRDVAVAEAAAGRLRELTAGEVIVETFDVTSADEVDEGIGRIEAAWGTPDILVNNAGIQRRHPFTEFPVSDWNDLLATNLTSAFLVAQRISRGMVARGSGKIVNVGSVQSKLARPNITPYSATKGGVVMLTRGLCADLGPAGIQANALAPGYFATELTKALVDDVEFSAWVAQRTPAGRWGRVHELVGALVFLSSSASDFVNGQTIYVDGGMTAVV